MNKTDVALRLLAEAYAEKGKIRNIPQFLENLQYRFGTVCKQFGKLSKNDSVLTLTKSEMPEHVKYFPNGFQNWMETFYEVVSFIENKRAHVNEVNPQEYSLIEETQFGEGSCGMYVLAEKWTNEFEKINEGRQWDGEFFDEVHEFCTKKDKI